MHARSFELVSCLGLAWVTALAGCAGADPNQTSTEDPGVEQGALCKPPMCHPGPATLVSGVAPTSIALSGTTAYFTNAYSPLNELDSVPITGGTKTVMTSSITSMTSVQLFGSTLFWADISAGSANAGTWYMAASGGTPTQIIQRTNDLVSGQAIAVYGTGSTLFSRRTHVLFADPLVAKLFDDQISLFAKTEVSLLPNVDPTTMLDYYPFSIVIDGSNVYFTHDSGGGLFRAPLGGGPATMLVSGVARAALAISGSTLYFEQGTSINRIAVTGGAVSTFANAACTVSALVATGDTLYWACPTTVVKQSLVGTLSTTLASGQDGPRSLAVDASYVYFGTASALKRIAR